MKPRFSLLLLLALAPLTLIQAQQPAPDVPVAAALSPYDEALERAYALGQLQVWDEARAALDEALQLAQTAEQKTTVYGQIGATYVAENRHQEAQAQFRLAMNAPGAPLKQKQLAHFALATSLRDAKDYAAAGREADAILAPKTYALSPLERAVALSIRGDAQMDAEAWSAARRTYDEVLSIKTDKSSPMFDFTRAAARFNVGKSYLRGGEPMTARLVLRGTQGSLATLPMGESMTDFLGWATQDLIAQSYIVERDDVNARVELELLLKMPGLPEDASAQARADLAKVRARLANRNR